MRKGLPKTQSQDKLDDSQQQAAQRTAATEKHASIARVGSNNTYANIAANGPRSQYIAQLQSLANASTSAPVQLKGDEGGLPGKLQTGIESLSGMSMDHVRVHYNSSKPAQLQAHAFAQGSEIHLAPGQEKHLPHEAWHVVQQAQGRVKPTLQMKKGVAINDDKGLEREADEMGAEAMKVSHETSPLGLQSVSHNAGTAQRQAVVQRVVLIDGAEQKMDQATALAARQIAELLDSNHADSIFERLTSWYGDQTTEKRDFDSLDDAVAAAWASLEQEDQMRFLRSETIMDSPTPIDTSSSLLSNHPRQSPPLKKSLTTFQIGNPEELEEATQQAIPATAPKMPQETRTRVGFEIELGVTYDFPETTQEELEKLVNQTLAVFGKKDQPLLEMIIDDIKEKPDGKGYTGQVEFRTCPLPFEKIDGDLGTTIRKAIKEFPTDMLTNPKTKPLAISRSGRQEAYQWEPTAELRDVSTLLEGAKPSKTTFTAPTNLAQHATTSIEIAAFGKLNSSDQGLLFPSGKGVKNKQGLIEQLGKITAGDETGLIDSTTTGRNSARQTVKTPIESLLAADETLVAPKTGKNAKKVTVGAQYTYPLGDISKVAAAIKQAEKYPNIQGQGDNKQGYRAIAEKLQPPLLDTVSGELRILVEHRAGEAFPRAVNAAMAGQRGELEKFALATTRMDMLRNQKTKRKSKPKS